MLALKDRMPRPTPVMALPMSMPAMGMTYWGLNMPSPTTARMKNESTDSPENRMDRAITALKRRFKPLFCFRTR